MATFDSNSTVKFADDTAVVGLISNNDEKAYLEEVGCLTRWCQDNNLLLNVSKTKEMLVDYGRKQGRIYSPLNIDGSPVERVDNFKYLGVQITKDLTWTINTDTVVRKSRQ